MLVEEQELLLLEELEDVSVSLLALCKAVWNLGLYILPVLTVFIVDEEEEELGAKVGGGGGVPVPLLALSDRLMSESSDT